MQPNIWKSASLLAALLVILGLFREAGAQNNPICKAKRYQCAEKSLPDGACVAIEDEQEKYYYVQPCEGEKSECPYDEASYGSPAMCRKPQTAVVARKLPFEECSKDEECLSSQCVNSRCKGKLESESCKIHDDCDAGLYCEFSGTAGVCIAQKEFDQACTFDEMCVNNCVCNNMKCAFYYTFTEASIADNPKACESGYIENGLCVSGLKTLNPGQPCTSDEDCMFVDQKGIVKKFGTCTCGYNAGSYSYCNLETGDQEFKDMTRALRFLTARNYGCHTLRRFGPCTNLYDDEYSDYHFKLNRLSLSPLVIGNDKCVAKVYTWEYWKYFLLANTLKFAWPALVVAGILQTLV